MAKNYSITFKSLRAGTTYVVNIGGGTGAAVALKGAASPFVTQEDDDEDMFKPVRTQTGYVRIIDDGLAADGVTAFDWKDLIPETDTSRPVTLTALPVGQATGTVVWQGYMQPQTFSGVLYGGAQEREYPVQCALSVLEGFDVESNSGEIKNFAYLINSIFANLSPTTTFSYFYFQGGGYVQEWLLKRFDWQNLMTDVNGVMKANYKCLTALEDICNFFGWSCRIQGKNVYFLSVDEDLSITEIESRDLPTLAGGEEVQGQTVGMVNDQLGDFVSIDNEDTVVPGIHSATVNADINKFDDIFDIPFDEIKDLFKNASVSETHQGDTYYFTKNLYPQEYSNGFVDIDCYHDQNYWKGRFSAYEIYVGSLADKHQYNFNYVLQCYDFAGGPSTNINEYCVLLRSKMAHSYQNGVITLNADYNSPGADTSLYIRAYLRVGDVCWNGSDWVSSDATFLIYMTGGKIADTRTLNSPYGDYTGIGIPVDSVGGIVDFRIVGLSSNGFDDRTVEFTSFTLGFVKANSAAPNNEDETNVYTAYNNNHYTDERTIDNIWASDNGNSAGFGIILDADGGYCHELSYDDGQTTVGMHPEQRLVNRMVAFYQDRRGVLRTESYEPDGVTPLNTVTVGGTDYYPLSISRDWRDDVTMMTMIDME